MVYIIREIVAGVLLIVAWLFPMAMSVMMHSGWYMCFMVVSLYLSFNVMDHYEKLESMRQFYEANKGSMEETEESDE